MYGYANSKPGLTVTAFRSEKGSQIERLELMHNRGLLHRDIQLGNCVTGLGENAHIIYMIDFGFSKRYIANGKHIPDSKAKRDFIGNYWFSSVNVHCRGKGKYSNFRFFSLGSRRCGHSSITQG